MIILRLKNFSKKRYQSIGTREITRREEFELGDEAIDRINSGENKEVVLDETILKHKEIHKRSGWKRDNTGNLVLYVLDRINK